MGINNPLQPLQSDTGATTGFTPESLGITVPADGQCGDNKTVTGTDAGPAINECLIKINSGYHGGVLYLPHPLPGYGYRIDTAVRIPRGVTLVGAVHGSNGGATANGDSLGIEPNWDSTARKFKIPPNAKPTFLLGGTPSPAWFNLDQPGAGIHGFAFLNPRQLLPDEYDFAGAEGDPPTVYNPVIQASTSSGLRITQLDDYNSWIFIKWYGQAGSVIEGIASQTHKTIILCMDGSEFAINDIFTNPGTVFSVGANTHGDGPLLDLNIAKVTGRNWQICGNPTAANPAVDVQVNWSFELNGCWMDQVTDGFRFRHRTSETPDGGGGLTAMVQINNFEYGVGNAGSPIKGEFWYVNNSPGSNPASFLVSNSILTGHLELKGRMPYYFSNCKFNFGTAKLWGSDATADPIPARDQGCQISYSNCDLYSHQGPDNQDGKSWAYFSRCTDSKVEANTGATLLSAIDEDKKGTLQFTVPVGTVLVSGAYIQVGEILLQRVSGDTIHFTIIDCQALAWNADKWAVEFPKGAAKTDFLTHDFEPYPENAGTDVTYAGEGLESSRQRILMPPVFSGRYANAYSGRSTRVPVFFKSSRNYTVSAANYPNGYPLILTYCAI